MRRPTDGRPGERDEVDLRGEDELLGDGVVGRRDDVHDAGGDVGLLGDQPTEARRVERRLRRRLHDQRVPGGQRLPDLVEHDLDRIVPGHDRGDDADRLPPHASRRHLTGELDHRVAEIDLPRVLVDELRRVAQRVRQGPVELGTVRHHARATDLADQLLAQELLLALERLLELEQAPLTERVIGRPGGLVERPARRIDRAVDVGGRRVGCLTDDGFGRGIDVCERSGLTVDELAVDEHPRLEGRVVDQTRGRSVTASARRSGRRGGN